MNEINTSIVTDSRYQRHLTAEGFPECPDRHSYIDNALIKAGLLNNKSLIKPRAATEEEIESCHSREHIEAFRRAMTMAPSRRSKLLDKDLWICKQSFDVACLAAGGVLSAVDAVMTSVAQRVFCNVRPPGHHACPSQAMGFCFFNNIAIGTRYAQKKYGVERVMIVDWDVHHGNGTQDIFYDDPSVLYFSTHQRGIYPLTGEVFDEGDGEAVGTNINVPIDGGVGSREKVLKAFDDVLVEAAERFKPNLIMISAGFDAHVNDPIGGLDLTTQDFWTLTKKVCALADQYCNGRIVSVLEGGYNLDAIAECSVAHVKALRGLEM